MSLVGVVDMGCSLLTVDCCCWPFVVVNCVVVDCRLFFGCLLLVWGCWWYVFSMLLYVVCYSRRLVVCCFMIVAVCCFG